MADSKLLHPDANPSLRLMKCSMCAAVADKPKLLPCLHTFCMKCLINCPKSSLDENSNESTTTILCPTCRKVCLLPEGGVENITPNYFVNNLVHRETLRKKIKNGDVISCTSCDETDENAVSWCLDCNDFLCAKCADTHKTLRKFKRDQVLSLEQLREDSDIVDTFPEKENCSKHPDEILKFYCETCEDPMCRDCIVVEHPSPDHKQADLKTVIPSRKAQLDELCKDCKDIPDYIDEVLKIDDEKIIELEANVNEAIDLYKDTAEKAEAAFLENIRRLEGERRMVIEKHKEILASNKAQICSGLELSKHVNEVGTMFDIGLMFAPLSNALSNPYELTPKQLDNHISKVGFVPMQDCSKSLGVLNNYRQWTLSKTIELNEISSPKGIAYNNNGELMVADSNNLIMIGNDGLVKKILSTQFDELETTYDDLQFKAKLRPSAVLAAGYDSWYATDESNFLKIIDDQGNLKDTIETSSAEINVIPQLRGIARNKEQQLFVGITDGKISSIRIYSENGYWLTKFDIRCIYPDFIAITPEDALIITGFNTDDNPRVQRQPSIYSHRRVVDDETKKICYDSEPYQFPAPADIAAGNFYPTGVCIHEGDKLIFVACYGETPGIYCYTFDGKYIGIVTKEVTAPQGIALTDLENTLAVCDGNKVKLFRCF